MPKTLKTNTPVALAVSAVPANWHYNWSGAVAIRTVVARADSGPSELALHRIINGVAELTIEKLPYNRITMRPIGLGELPKSGTVVWASVKVISEDSNDDDDGAGVSDVLYRGSVVRAQGSRNVDVKFDDNELGSKIPLTDCALE